VSWSCARRRLRRSALCKLSGGLVDLVDPNLISSKVRYYQEVARWVYKGMMRVGSFLSRRVYAFAGVLDCLERLSSGQRQFEGCQLRRLAVDQLASMVSTGRCWLTSERLR
jgi:hypothetical protein